MSRFGAGEGVDRRGARAAAGWMIMIVVDGRRAVYAVAPLLSHKTMRFML